MTEYSCEVWIAHKCTFNVQAESVDEGDKIVMVSVNG
jgi:hypothetical protein